MDTAANQNQYISSQQIKQRLLDLFDLNEDFEKSRLELNQWNELFEEVQESLQNERNEIQEQSQHLKQTQLNLIKKTQKLFDSLITSLHQKKAKIYYIIGFYGQIPISFEVGSKLTKTQNDSGVWEYQVQGYQEIFSIQQTPINPQKKYKLELEIKTCSNQLSFIGYKSFHQKQPIYDRQCRIFQGTDVKLIGLDIENKALIVDNTNNNLSIWNSPNTNYYEKYIGFYKNGNINEFIKAEDVIGANYVGDTLAGAYREIDILNNKIYLTDWSWDYYMSQLHSQANINQTVLMNHGGMNTYDYSEAVQKHIPNWEKRSYNITTFRRFTDAIEVCILANYQGTQDKVFEFRNVNLIIFKDDDV
ncbi:hypothetical protein ABPG72_022322 [Tetrahymena utriculariae]